jgi:hypothetical protein
VDGNLAAPAEANRISGNHVGGDGDAGAKGIEINASGLGTRIAGNEIEGFAEPLDDAGAGTALKGNLCDGAPCP